MLANTCWIAYAAFLSLKAVFGYHSGAFYAVAVLLHFLNTLLLWKLVGRATGNGTVALLSAVLFHHSRTRRRQSSGWPP